MCWQIEHPVYRTYIGLGALTVLIVLAVVMFWAIFLSPEENPSIDPEVSRKVYERMGERDQAPPPPKKTNAQKLEELRKFLDSTDSKPGNFLFTAAGREKKRKKDRRKQKHE
eukprot:INCI14565.2.p2 GENE.INCI14565.2~~INCI14565.2.p2  ORF type:complete len:112 (+),score=21.83 INCI14565.2:592-927(+)